MSDERLFVGVMVGGPVEALTRRKNKTYPEGRSCVSCGRPISIYNKHKTCWEHTTEEKYVNRGGRRARAS